MTCFLKNRLDEGTVKLVKIANGSSDRALESTETYLDKLMQSKEATHYNALKIKADTQSGHAASGKHQIKLTEKLSININRLCFVYLAIGKGSTITETSYPICSSGLQKLTLTRQQLFYYRFVFEGLHLYLFSDTFW